MKGGKSDNKVIGPLFPRLHVNDTEKGGPRAPPRNKMALYEQLSVPFQRFTTPSHSILPHMHYNNNTLVAPASSREGCSHGSNIFSPFYIPPPSRNYSAEKSHSQSSNWMNLNTTAADFEKKSARKVIYRTSKVAPHISSTSESNLLCSNTSNSKNSNGKKIRDDEVFVVPAYIHSAFTQGSDKDQHDGGRERLSSSKYEGRSTVSTEKGPERSVAVNDNSSIQLQTVSNKPQGHFITMDQRLRQRDCITSHDKPIEHDPSNDRLEMSGSHQLTGRNTNRVEPLKHMTTPLDKEDHHCSGNEFGNVAKRAQRGYQNASPKCNYNYGNDPAVGESLSRVRSECKTDSIWKCQNEFENSSDDNKEKARVSIQGGDVDRNDYTSDTSMLDSIPAFEISPDDVLGIIGQKLFWKARRAIVNQQRVFAVQVFELHRLIKVQMLIAGSPEILCDTDSYLHKRSQIAPAQNPPADYLLKSQPEVVKQKDDAPKPDKNIDHSTANTVQKSSSAHPRSNSTSTQRQGNQHSNCGPCCGSPPAAPMANDNKSGSWCFQPPPGNQWLVPVLSPSEGLVYKPYTGPYPPAVGFVAPIYGGCSSLSVPSVPTYGLPSLHHQPAIQSYFPPYSMPIVNPPPGGTQKPYEQAEQLSMGNVNFKMQLESSWNMSNQRSEAFSCCVRKFQMSKDSEAQGSSVISHFEGAQGASRIVDSCNMLPLFPTSPATNDPDRSVQGHSSNQHSVIKVVPHNPRSATESAVRIFHSIQEERQQQSSV